MIRAVIEIHGIVQGVGFRPFVHKYIKEAGLAGTIKNTSSGVEMELEGSREIIEKIIRELPAYAPKLAVIEKTEYSFTDELAGYTDFTILQSRTERKRNTLISPDIAICDDCFRELMDPADRRYRYPFINCTNCGPRFTIIEDVPYDRKNTSMKQFAMCDECSEEYGNIENRRYHAQPDCCPECGPKMSFYDAEGNLKAGDAVKLAKESIKNGQIIAVKGLGGMHLACRCDSEEIVRTLRTRKQRDEKPFAIMCRNLDSARKICEISAEEENVLSGSERPIVLLKKKNNNLKYISENRYIGVMLPYTPLHHLLFDDELDMMIMTSANLSDTPIMYRNDEALEKLSTIADGFLLHNRIIQTRCDDSLCWIKDGKEYFARRSRGYVPFPIKTEQSRGMILACGAEQKASFCLSKEGYIFPSQHIGDLKNFETYDNYTQQIKHFENMFDIKPAAVCCDMHPDYMSTNYAEERAEKENIPLIKIQHHHAHMASCMADNGLDCRTIGLVWDGTGYGTDGTIWGGECLAGDYSGFERVSSIRPIPLPGGDRAAKEISRTAYAVLKESGCSTDGIENSEMYSMILEKNINCPKSSGMGRLFDAVAAITGIRTKCSYEGQGAILLEAAASDDMGTYPTEWEMTVPPRFDWRPMIRQIVTELENGENTADIAARFMNTVMIMGLQACRMASERFGIKEVVLSGGTFQNMYIMDRLPKMLRDEGFAVYTHHRVSANDEGLSLGQILIAQNRGNTNVSGNTTENY